MIQVSKSKLPSWQLMIFGLSEILDGLVTVISLGYLGSNLSMRTISYFTRKSFKNHDHEALAYVWKGEWTQYKFRWNLDI